MKNVLEDHSIVSSHVAYALYCLNTLEVAEPMFRKLLDVEAKLKNSENIRETVLD